MLKYCTTHFPRGIVFIRCKLRLNLKAHNPLVFTTYSTNKVRKVLFNSAGSMFCNSPSSRFSFPKNVSSNFTFRIVFSFVFLFSGLSHVILDRSIVFYKPFLDHFFKLKHLPKLRFLKKKVKHCQLKQYYLVMGHTLKNMIRGT